MDDYTKLARTFFCFFAVIAAIAFVGVELDIKWVARGATAAIVAGASFAALQRP